MQTPASAVKPVAKEAYAPVIYSKWELLQDSDEDSDQVFRYTPPHFTCCTYRAGADDTLQATAAADVAAQQFKVKQAVGPNTPTFTGSIFTPQESLADNDNIWGGIQPCAGVTVKSEQPHSKSACEVSLVKWCGESIQDVRGCSADVVRM